MRGNNDSPGREVKVSRALRSPARRSPVLCHATSLCIYASALVAKAHTQAPLRTSAHRSVAYTLYAVPDVPRHQVHNHVAHDQFRLVLRMCKIWWVEEFREGDGFLEERVLGVRHCI